MSRKPSTCIKLNGCISPHHYFGFRNSSQQLVFTGLANDETSCCLSLLVSPHASRAYGTIKLRLRCKLNTIYLHCMLLTLSFLSNYFQTSLFPTDMMLLTSTELHYSSQKQHVHCTGDNVYVSSETLLE